MSTPEWVALITLICSVISALGPVASIVVLIMSQRELTRIMATKAKISPHDLTLKK